MKIELMGIEATGSVVLVARRGGVFRDKATEFLICKEPPLQIRVPDRFEHANMRENKERRTDMTSPQ